MEEKEKKKAEEELAKKTEEKQKHEEKKVEKSKGKEKRDISGGGPVGLGSLTYLDRNFADPLTKMGPRALIYPDREVPNPMAKIVTGSLTYLERDQRGSASVSPFILSLSVNGECNLKCPHCIERDYKRGYDRYSLLKSRLEEVPDTSIVWTSIAGKEPTITPKRLEEVAKISRKKSDKVILMSNGTLLDEKLQEKLSENVDYLDISVDGTDSYKSTKTDAWKNVLTASKNGFKKVSVLTILGRENYQQVRVLGDKIANESDGKVAHSIGFYLGCPGDPSLLKENEIISAVESILNTKVPVVIQIGLAYSRFLPRIFRGFGIDIKTKRYDSKTGIPSFEIGKNSLLVPASHLETSLNLLRAEIDCNVYFGCSHLMLRGDTSYLAVGSLEKESLGEILEKISSGKSDLVENASLVSKQCLDSECYEFCRGGDRLNGIIFTGEPRDPFCEKLSN